MGVWVAVDVEHPTLGIRAIHYVETPGRLVRPTAWAEREEREKGYLVHGAWLWGKGEGR